jgi:hypothetical protein
MLTLIVSERSPWISNTKPGSTRTGRVVLQLVRLATAQARSSAKTTRMYDPEQAGEGMLCIMDIMPPVVERCFRTIFTARGMIGN